MNKPRTLTLKDVTEAEVHAYLNEISGFSERSEYTPEQTSEIGTAMHASGDIQAIITALVSMEVVNRSSIALTCLVAGFQLGRHFEVKAMVRAMREGR